MSDITPGGPPAAAIPRNLVRVPEIPPASATRLITVLATTEGRAPIRVSPKFRPLTSDSAAAPAMPPATLEAIRPPIPPKSAALATPAPTAEPATPAQLNRSCKPVATPIPCATALVSAPRTAALATLAAAPVPWNGATLPRPAPIPPPRADSATPFQLNLSCMLNELRVAFTIGFVILLPFLLIDLVVSAILLSLGMLMVPPATISLPLKILMFVLIDGWALILEGLIGSFR
jgi:hypothetical protein